MIHFLINQDSLEVGVARYLRTRGTSLVGLLHPTTYDDVLGAAQVRAGTWVFTALDTLSPAERALASSLHEQLVAHGQRTLNDPARSLLRFALLDALFHAGLNSFRAVRVRDYRGGLRFPVFLRSDAGHCGNLTSLLHTETDVRRALLSARLRCLDFDNLLLVEFLDLADGGQLHKYSAFRVGDRIIGRHFQTSATHWMIKSESGERTAAAAARECAYMEENPHASRLMPLFQLAGIEYGRMDYALHHGRIEVFEINTAPTLGRGGPPGAPREDDDAYRTAVEPTVVAYHGRLRDAFRSLAAPDVPGELAVRWDDALLASRVEERRVAAQRMRYRAQLSTLANLGGIREVRRGVEAVLRSMTR